MLLKTLSDTLPKEVMQHARWDILYCYDLVVSQQALRDGRLADLLRVTLPEAGTLHNAQLLLESTGLTNLNVLHTSEEEQVVRLNVTRRYYVLPCFTMHVMNAYAHAVEDLRRNWIGEQYILVEYRDAGGYSALVTQAAASSVQAWAERHRGAVVWVDGDMCEYNLMNNVEQVKDMLRILHLAQRKARKHGTETGAF